MFLEANSQHITNYGAIPMIAPKDIRACLPARFTGKDVDLVAAEAAFEQSCGINHSRHGHG